VSETAGGRQGTALARWGSLNKKDVSQRRDEGRNLVCVWDKGDKGSKSRNQKRVTQSEKKQGEHGK